MKNLIIQGTYEKPTVKFFGDKGELLLEGSSLPENVIEVYDPIINWLRNYSESPQKRTKIEFFFDYLNTSSSYMMTKIINMLNKITSCEELIINWNYLSGDYDMRDFGLEILGDTNLKYNLVERSC